ncbi:MAG: LysM peptidoglycan-binding domain-containing protein [Desulfobulbaceae bacterium]|jgi:membrane-bound lytic murein transglycosylase D|nr:LysM peptidoglycan-binding domain-containing protein [Desulfobulbaceae bacterium]
MRSLFLSLSIIAALVFTFIMPVYDGVAAEQFPVHGSMRANVEFWKSIYAKHPSTSGLIHDSSNLAVVYEVVDLRGAGSRKAKKKKIKGIKDKYQKVLTKLGRGTLPKTKLERRVYNLFGKNPTRDQFNRARDRIRFQLGQKDRFLAGLIRSGQYLDRIKTIFRSQGLPEDLAYLPHVESSFNYKAYSKFGAAGIWQFTRGTGRRYMTVDYVVDERRDPIVASRAAAQYLKENYQKLGSWPFALTAYNHGENGMLRAQREHGSFQNVFDHYDGRRFGFASKNFYASFIAARYVAKNYQNYFGAVSFDKPIPYHTVKMPGFASVKSVASFFHISSEAIQRVNPGLRPPVFQGQKHIPKGYIFRLPGGAERMAHMASAMPSSMFSAKQKRSKFYRVQRGDTAGKIARKHRVSVNELVLANGLSRRAKIYVGQNLRIPSLGEEPIMLAQNLPKKKSMGVAEIQRPEKTAQLPALQKGMKWAPSQGSFGLVAAKEGKSVVVASLKADRPQYVAISQSLPVSPEIIGPGKVKAKPVLPVAGPPEIVMAPVIPEAEALAEGESGEEPVNPYVLTGNFSVAKLKQINGHQTGKIQVETDETLGHYADWLDIPTRRIRSLNKFRYGRPIHYGQKLRIPFGKVDREEFEERRYLYHKKLVEDFYQAYTVEGEKEYKIQKGDTLWSLCHEQFDMPFWLLKQYNPGFNFNSIHPGNEIKVPVIESPDESNSSVIARVIGLDKQQSVSNMVQ